MESTSTSIMTRMGPFGQTIATPAPPTAPSRQTFDFFGLAGELRDMILDEVLLDSTSSCQPRRHSSSSFSETDKCTCGFCVSSLRSHVRGTPTVNLLLVNKQFHSEVQSRARRTATLVVRDYVFSDFPEGFKPCFRGMSLGLGMPNLHLDLTLECSSSGSSEEPQEDGDEREGEIETESGKAYEAMAEMQMHRAWIDQLLPRLTQLRSVTIELRLHSQSEKLGCWEFLRQTHSALSSIEKLKALDVHLADYGCGVEDWDYGVEGRHVLSWNRRTRGLEDVVAVGAEKEG